MADYWEYDKWTDPACEHDWNPISKGEEFCDNCGGVRSPREKD